VAIIGSGQSLLASRLLNEKDRRLYYASSGVLTALPFVIIVAVLAAYANSHGLISLFKLLSTGFIILIVPLYMLLVFWSTKS
jgi:uncharacterized membrane protein